MNVRGGEEDVNTRAGSVFQSFPGTFDIRTAGSRQSSNNGAADDRGDGPYGFKVAIGGNGEPGFDHVGAQTVELMRQPQFFLMVHAAPGRLLSVAQGGIENGDSELLRGHGASFENLRRSYLLRSLLWYGRRVVKQNL